MVSVIVKTPLLLGRDWVIRLHVTYLVEVSFWDGVVVWLHTSRQQQPVSEPRAV
jgi:hypothetical protein